MVQFDGPHGKVSVSYLRQGGYTPPAEPAELSFAGKTVLITGCASGLGWEAAVKIAALRPKRLILSPRTAAQGEATKEKLLERVKTLDASALEVIPVDYLCFVSIKAFVETLKRSTSSLDCVLLCAGVILPNRQTTKDGWPITFQVNVLSPALIGLELLPLLNSTPGSVMEFVNSTSYCNVSSDDVGPLIDDPSVSALEYFNDEQRWTAQRAYYESKLMLMFVVQGLADMVLQGQKSGDTQTPVIMAACPGQCTTSLYRNFPVLVRTFMFVFNSFVARTAEQGSRTLVTGLLQDKSAHGRLWVNDTFDDWSPNIAKDEWTVLQSKVWGEVSNTIAKIKSEN